MDNLDMLYDATHPAVSAEDRRFQWQGVMLTRKQEIPIGAFQILEDRPESFMSLVDACRAMIEESDQPAFDQVIAANPNLGANRLTGLVRYIMEKSMDRPTQPAGNSSPGASGTGTPSTNGASTSEGWTPGDSVPGASQTSPTPISSPTISPGA